MIQKNELKAEKNPYLVFLKKLILLFAILTVFDYVIGSILRHFYFTQDSGLLYRTTYSLEETTADLLVFGSSRAVNQYYPEIFEKKLKMSYYNVGRYDADIIYDYAILQGVLKRYTPKVILLDIRKGEFADDKGSYDRLSFLLPYYQDQPEIRPIVNLKSRYEKIKLLSRIYPFNSMLFTIAIDNLDFNKKRMEDIQGYIPLTNDIDQPRTIDKTPVKYELDPEKITLLNKFIQQCLHAGIKLYIVNPPYYNEQLSPDTTIETVGAIAKKYNVPFLDYTNDPGFVSSKLFSDLIHLNENGSKLFSEALTDTLLRIKGDNAIFPQLKEVVNSESPTEKTSGNK